VIFVLWLALEYYFGSPFLPVRRVRAFGILARSIRVLCLPVSRLRCADFIWWHWTSCRYGRGIRRRRLLAFAAGTFIRLDTLFGLLGIAQVQAGPARQGVKAAGPGADTGEEAHRVALAAVQPPPRYFGTFLQLVGAALVFRSWGGLVLALAIGLPFIWVQVQYEDRRLRGALKGDLQSYPTSVPSSGPGSGPQLARFDTA